MKAPELPVDVEIELHPRSPQPSPASAPSSQAGVSSAAHRARASRWQLKVGEQVVAMAGLVDIEGRDRRSESSGLSK